MLQLTFLGTSNAVPDSNHENTHMAIAGEKRSVLIDCSSSPLVRLERAGLDLNKMTDLILTHFHPDHVSGAPSLLMQSWLTGRRTALHIHGIGDVLDRLEKLLTLYNWEKWPNMFPVHLHLIPEQEMQPLIQDDDIRVFTSPVCHMIPNIGLRIESLETKASVVYSCDTEPCENLVHLAAGADYLIHEASGALPGHTSAFQAGQIAQRALAKQLYLIHYNPRLPRPGDLVKEAHEAFSGPVILAQDYMSIIF